ncbi:hypothetical protein KFZ70_02225 [Tamlana fucoidanivorans]|uniref:Galactose oxidase n=1 Tax=Allotamlana fucoidanivorans TaxID=2583814 RepID=A0A5C4SGH5_9FLAO|nr:kelch repeat-containing protein [Tamlana fucoidanivorans]TNJ42536.1 hypothetical protein FGF67_13645 [Tamlana fucoidanivorans]
MKGNCKNTIHKVNFQVIIWISVVLATLPSCKSQQCTDGHAQWIDLNEDENYTARHECSFVQAGNEFIMFGGRESAKKLDIYNFNENTWRAARNQAPKEFNHFQATFYKGFVWVIGAFKTNNFPRELPEDHVWLYHPVTDTWIPGPKIPKNRRRGGAGLAVYNNKFYLIGGNTIGHDGGYVNWFDEYDPAKNTWKILEDASQARDHFSAAIIDNTLYAVAGRHSGGEGGVFAPLIKVVDTYNFDTKQWSTLQHPLPTPRAAPGVAVFQNELFVMGGEGEAKGPAYNIVEAYNPKTKKWTKKPAMHYARHGTQAIQSGKGIYIAAGSPNRGGGRQHNMEVYHEDSAEGSPITASHIEAPKSISIPRNASKTITIKNTGGNSASFITSVSITGEHRKHFKLLSLHDFTLVDAEASIKIEVANTGHSFGVTSKLKIMYNGISESEIKIVCE